MIVNLGWDNGFIDIKDKIDLSCFKRYLVLLCVSVSEKGKSYISYLLMNIKIK